MECVSPEIIVGFPEMWEPVYRRYQPFFDFAHKLAPIVTEMIRTPVAGPLRKIVGRMAAAASNTHGALLLLVLNGYGHDAMKLARSLFEIEIAIIRLKTHPEEIQDFLDYHHVQQKQVYELFDEEQKARVPKERREAMMANYDAVLPRFATGRDKTRPRNEWSSVSLFERAKEAGSDYLDLYRMFYRQASSIDHLDFSGIAAYQDENMLADMAPSWSCLDDALVATGCVFRSVNLFDEIADLGFKDRLEAGPGADYIAACQSLRATA